MIVQKIGKYLIGQKTYNNVIEASYTSIFIRKVLGTAVMVTTLQSGNIVVRKFCPRGFLLFVLWNSLYLFCMYKVLNEDQVIVRKLLTTTKLRRYGDDYERFSGLIFVLFTMAVTPFKLSGNKLFMQKIFDIDKVLKRNGETVDYNKTPIRSVSVFMVLVSIYVTGLACQGVFLKSIDVSLNEKVFINTYTDVQAFLISFTFMYYVLILKDRFEVIKQSLIRIREENIWKYNAFDRIEEPKNSMKVLKWSDKQICDKIRFCAKIYSLLCKSCCLLMNIVGWPVHVCFFTYKIYLILYMFYLMEATQIMVDLTRCIEFIVLCVWEIATCIFIMILVIYIAETTMREIVHIRYVVHDIINENISPSVNKEAMQFSMQLLHEKPVFSVLGLYELNNELMFEGSKTITTYLVILLQFVTGHNQGS